MTESTVVRIIWGVAALKTVLSMERVSAPVKSKRLGRRKRHIRAALPPPVCVGSMGTSFLAGRQNRPLHSFGYKKTAASNATAT